MKQRCKTFLMVSCSLLSAASAIAGYDIHFHSGTVSPVAGDYGLANQLSAQHAVLQFYSALTAENHSRLSAAGVELLGYLPDRAYAAKLSAPLSRQELASLGVRAVLPFAPEYKLHPRLLESDFGPWSVYENGLRMFNVDIFPDVALAEAAALIEKSGYPVGDHIDASHTLVVAADPGKIVELASLEPVMFINETSPPLEDLNQTVRVRLHVNEVQAAPYNLAGNGVTILVYDGGMVGTHADFGNRVTLMEDGIVAGHATHVAGTVGGSGSESGGNQRGMAPAATIISGEYDACIPFCFYNSPNDISEDYIFARMSYGVEVTTNSIGANVSPNSYPCSWFGDYELTSRIVDGLVRQTGDRPLIQFWAAGNERGDPGCGISTYRCMSIPASAKNIITIGATTSTDALASFTSWGPTDDGRIKPEVCAMGVNVTSCAVGTGYTTMSGTSMATPASAGVSCLILEQWHNQYTGAPDPLPETMKALYINSANDLGSTGPDFQSGFGLVNAQRAVDQLIAGGVMQNQLAIGEVFEHQFVVPASTPALDVSLAWSDVPAVGNVIPTLVNDLDLVLVAPDATQHLPWVLNPASPASPATTGRDSVNICEKVRVSNPAAGTWTIRVSGEVNMGAAQTFGLASSVPLVAQWAEVHGVLHVVSDPQNRLAGSVEVIGDGIVTLTDNQGNFSLFVPQGATYSMLARAYGHVPVTHTFDVSSGDVEHDFAMVPATPNVTINGTVETQLGTAVVGAVVTYEFPNASIPNDTTNATGNFTKALPRAETYIIRATLDGREAMQAVTLPNSGSVDITFVINDTRFAPVGPDGGGYYCYENGDTGYAPTFEYESIAPAAGGPGTLIGPGNGNDWTTTVALPFNARFYGTVVGGLTVSADGWIGFGTVAPGTQPWTNGYLPTTAAPNNSVYIFWDDLFPYHVTEGGQIASYYDEPNDRFIVEYYQVSQFDPVSNKVTAQFVLYSMNARQTSTGDSEFEVHYQRFDHDGPDTDQDATVGIENSNGTQGLFVFFDSYADPNQHTITAGTALRYTTGPILGTGTLTGQITTIPATDVSGGTIRVGALAFSPNGDGSFSVSNVPAGQFRLEFEFVGYENLLSEQFTIPIEGQANVDMTVYRLDAPQNLVGEFDSEAFQVTLAWDPPTWDGGLRSDGIGSLDALSDYTLLIGGRTPITGITQTSYVYSPPAVGIFRFWVVANYDGGISDSSNMVQFIVTDAEDANALMPTEFYLNQNYPNPFNPTTNITFGLPVESQVSLDVFDITGRNVATILNVRLSAGHYTQSFDATGLGSGVYFYRLNTGKQQLIRKMMLLR